MSELSIEHVGRRVYITGNSYPIRDQLRAAGCHWDGVRKQWWIGDTKADQISTLVGTLAKNPAPKEDLSRRSVYARVIYKARTYYVIGRGSGRYRLTTLDGSLDFWVDQTTCEIKKEYQPREVWNGRYRGSDSVLKYPTLKSIRDFIAESRTADKAIARGEVPVGYAIDLEDGGIKRVGDCDIPDRP